MPNHDINAFRSRDNAVDTLDRKKEEEGETSTLCSVEAVVSGLLYVGDSIRDLIHEVGELRADLRERG